MNNLTVTSKKKMDVSKMKPTIFHHFSVMRSAHKGGKKEEVKVRATACGVIYADGEGAQHLKIGVTFCSPKDSFSRRIGRSKSRTKACQDPLEVLELQEEKLAKKAMITFIEEIFTIVE